MTVKYKDSIEYKALQRIKKIPGNIVLRQDLTNLGSYRQVSRIFKKLVDANKIVKIGAGVYAKAYFSVGRIGPQDFSLVPNPPSKTRRAVFPQRASQSSFTFSA